MMDEGKGKLTEIDVHAAFARTARISKPRLAERTMLRDVWRNSRGRRLVVAMRS